MIDIIEHTFFAINAGVVRFDLIDKSRIYAHDDEKKTAFMEGVISCATHLKGYFGLSNGKGLLQLLRRDDLRISSHNEKVRDVTHSLTFYNRKTDVETDFYFDKKENIEGNSYVLKEGIENYQIEFDVDDKFRQRFKFQSKVEELSKLFYVTNENGYLKFKFGELGSILGSFIVDKPLRNKNLGETIAFYKAEVIKLLKMEGEMKMYISSVGLLKITCKTEYAEYSYYIPAHSH